MTTSPIIYSAIPLGFASLSLTATTNRNSLSLVCPQARVPWFHPCWKIRHNLPYRRPAEWVRLEFLGRGNHSAFPAQPERWALYRLGRTSVANAQQCLGHSLACAVHLFCQPAVFQQQQQQQWHAVLAHPHKRAVGLRPTTSFACGPRTPRN